MWLVVSVGLSLLFVSLPFGMAYLTYADASLRSSDHPAFWGLLSLFVPPVGALGYRAVRPQLGEPTRHVPRHTRWISKIVRIVAAGLGAATGIFIVWVLFLSPLSFSGGAFRTTVGVLAGLGFVYWLTPTWPESAARLSADSDRPQDRPQSRARGSDATTAKPQFGSRDATERGGPALSWRGKLGFLGGLVACLLLSAWSVPLFSALDSTLLQFFVVILVLMTAGIVLGCVYRPYSSIAFPNARPADTRGWSEYADRCRAFGSPVNGVWVADNLKGNVGLAEIAGVLPWNRHLLLDEEFFETYDERQRLAVVAQQVSLADSYHWPFAKSLTYLALLAYYGLLVVAIELAGGTNPFPDWPLVPEVFIPVLLAIGVWHGRRKVYRADRFAADRTDRETVIGALESLDARNAESDEERVKAWLLSTFWTRPSPRKRVEQLRNRR
jgi:hypothetical protein